MWSHGLNSVIKVCMCPRQYRLAKSLSAGYLQESWVQLSTEVVVVHLSAKALGTAVWWCCDTAKLEVLGTATWKYYGTVIHRRYWVQLSGS